MMDPCDSSVRRALSCIIVNGSLEGLRDRAQKCLFPPFLRLLLLMRVFVHLDAGTSCAMVVVDDGLTEYDGFYNFKFTSGLLLPFDRVNLGELNCHFTPSA